MSLDKFLEDMAKREDRKAESDTKTSLADKITMLRNAFVDFSTPVSLKPGDIVRGKKVYTENHIRSWDQPHILLEILPEPVQLTLDSDNVGHCTAAKRYDAVIAQIIREDNQPSVVRHLADLREWELFPEAEKYIKTHS